MLYAFRNNERLDSLYVSHKISKLERIKKENFKSHFHFRIRLYLDFIPFIIYVRVFFFTFHFKIRIVMFWRAHTNSRCNATYICHIKHTFGTIDYELSLSNYHYFFFSTSMCPQHISQLFVKNELCNLLSSSRSFWTFFFFFFSFFFSFIKCGDVGNDIIYSRIMNASSECGKVDFTFIEYDTNTMAAAIDADKVFHT